LAALSFVAALPVLTQLPAMIELPAAAGELLVRSQEALQPVVDRSSSSVRIESAGSAALAVDWSSLALVLVAVWASVAMWRVVGLMRAAVELQQRKRRARPVASHLLPLPGAVLRDCEVRESAEVRSPMLVGFVRPCILLPQGLLSQLDRSQLSLVLLHEIAHVRRGDMWLLLVQRLIAAIYFYNPVVHWLCRRIDEERECACDDRAIRSAQESGTSYADCLIRVTRFARGADAPLLAVAAVQKPAQLRVRVERLLSRSAHDDISTSWRPIAGALVTFSAVTAVLSLSVPHVSNAGANTQQNHASTESSAALGQRLVRLLVDTRGPVDPQRVRQLIEEGADINYALPGDGTPLIVAARRGDLPIVELLLRSGADVDGFSSGDGNPLIRAAAEGHLQVATTLVEHGANVNAQDVYDETPLINASRRGRLPIVDYLISKGADVNRAVEVSTTNGLELRSPLSEASKYGHADVVERLKQAGAVR
jgi:beta-lactamase regulating signal transducer with metallopeptidase domain